MEANRGRAGSGGGRGVPRHPASEGVPGEEGAEVCPWFYQKHEQYYSGVRMMSVLLLYSCTVLVVLKRNI